VVENWKLVYIGKLDLGKIRYLGFVSLIHRKT
jgi:hypothetical protein